MKYFALLYILVSLALSGSDYDQNRKNIFSGNNSYIHLMNWKFQVGDDLMWSNLDYNCDMWKPLPLKKKYLKTDAHVYWYKTTLTILDTLPDHDYIIKHYIINSASEVYWDGVLVLKNGNVGYDLKSECPGKYTAWKYLPKRLLTPGKHQISVRVSNFHFPNKAYYGWPTVASYKWMVKQSSSWLSEVSLVATVLVMSVIF